MSVQRRLPLALLFLRLGVFIVMLMWTLDKFVKPDHAIGIFKRFYLISDISQNFLMVIASLQLAVVIAFVIGFKKRFSYAIIFAMHAVSTIAAYNKYLDFSSLLFFAAWPMLAACFALYYLRDAGTIFVIDRPKYFVNGFAATPNSSGLFPGV